MDNSSDWVRILVDATPFLLLIGFWLFMMYQMQGVPTIWLRSARRRRIVSDLDQLLIESEKRIAEPKEKLFVRLALTGNETVEGQLIWANAQFIKFHNAAGGRDGVIPKGSIAKFERLPQ